MGRWRWKDKYGGPPQRWLGPATTFAAGRGACGRDALPGWVTDGADEQSTVDLLRAAVAKESADESDGDGGDGSARRSTPPNRSVRLVLNVVRIGVIPPGWR